MCMYIFITIICLEFLKCVESKSFKLKFKFNFLSVVLRGKKSSKQSASRRLSSPASSINFNSNPENSEIFEFKQLLDTIQLAPLSQKEATACIAKLR